MRELPIDRQTRPSPTPPLPAESRRALARLNARAWGIAMGLLLGLSLAVATLILVAKGGAQVGPHLGLLGIVLPGYRVTAFGAVIGFVYMFVIGYALGRATARLYALFARAL